MFDFPKSFRDEDYEITLPVKDKKKITCTQFFSVKKEYVWLNLTRAM